MGAVEIACADCGEPFAAKRSTARFCSDKCRVRHHRKKGPKLPAAVKKATARAAALAAAEEDAAPEAPTEDVEPEERPATVSEAVRVELAKADKLHTVKGQSALVLARRLDSPTLDTGSAVAALVKQLEATLDAALADAENEVDELELMRRRRQEKLSG